jgi:hypothetical protein
VRLGGYAEAFQRAATNERLLGAFGQLVRPPSYAARVSLLAIEAALRSVVPVETAFRLDATSWLGGA